MTEVDDALEVDIEMWVHEMSSGFGLWCWVYSIRILTIAVDKTLAFFVACHVKIWMPLFSYTWI